MNNIRAIVAASLLIIAMQACTGSAKKQAAESKSAVNGNTGNIDDAAARPIPGDEASQHPNAGTPIAEEQKQNSKVQQSRMEFVRYNDDGDYFLLLAKDKDGNRDFINNVVEDRSLNRGDLVKVKWKEGIITIAGDGDTPQAADLLLSVTKIRDGKVSNFKKSYKNELKYVAAKDREFSASYLDKVEQDLEYYLASSSNKYLREAIAGGQQISFTLQEEQRSRRMFMVAAFTIQGHPSPIQWIYIDQENGKLFEWDDAENTLVNEM